MIWFFAPEAPRPEELRLELFRVAIVGLLWCERVASRAGFSANAMPPWKVVVAACAYAPARTRLRKRLRARCNSCSLSRPGGRAASSDARYLSTHSRSGRSRAALVAANPTNNAVPGHAFRPWWKHARCLRRAQRQRRRARAAAGPSEAHASARRRGWHRGCVTV